MHHLHVINDLEGNVQKGLYLTGSNAVALRQAGLPDDDPAQEPHADHDRSRVTRPGTNAHAA